MKSPLALLLVALVGVTACTDSATAPSDFTARAAITASNPPPPPVTGELSGSFSVPLSDESALSSALGSLQFSVAGSATTPLHRTFSQIAVYDKDLSTGISSVLVHGDVGIWVSDAGASVGHGAIHETDASGNLWTISLSQIHSPAGASLVVCPSNTDHDEFCVRVSQPVSATVQRFRGLDDAGNPTYDLPIHTSESSLTFVWHLPPS